MTRETSVQFPVESYQRLKKWYLIPHCLTLTIIRSWSRVKWSNAGKGVTPSLIYSCNSCWKGIFRAPLDYICVSWLIVVEGNPKAPFPLATTSRFRGGSNFFPWIFPLTLGLYLIMLSVKQGGIKYHFLSL